MHILNTAFQINDHCAKLFQMLNLFTLAVLFYRFCLTLKCSVAAISRNSQFLPCTTGTLWGERLLIHLPKTQNG
jgi:hypothetical protein